MESLSIMKVSTLEENDGQDLHGQQRKKTGHRATMYKKQKKYVVRTEKGVWQMQEEYTNIL